MKFAYADPPYFGLAKKLYGKMHPEAAVYDTLEGHAALIRRLEEEFSAGWALSLGSQNLKDILPLCPRDARVASWMKTFSAFKKVSPNYGWEPVIFKTQNRKWRGNFRRDWVACPMAMHKGFKGAKPMPFCVWIFEDLLGMSPDDELVDLFPGSGSVTRAFDAWRVSATSRLLSQPA